MKDYITVVVEVEFSTCDIRTFYEKVPATCQCPTGQAIANVKARMKDTVKYHHLLNYWAEDLNDWAAYLNDWAE